MSSSLIAAFGRRCIIGSNYTNTSSSFRKFTTAGSLTSSNNINVIKNGRKVGESLNYHTLNHASTSSASSALKATQIFLHSRSYNTMKSCPSLKLNSITGIGESTPFMMIQSRTMASKKHKAVLRLAKGFRGRSKNTFRAAIRRLEKALQYAYRDRRTKKRNFRKLWIQRVNAGVRQHGMSYSRFIRAAPLDANIVLNRRMLSELASNEPFSFKSVVDVVKMKANLN